MISALVAGLALIALLFAYSAQKSRGWQPGPFTLETVDGESFSRESLADRLAVVFFGYTYCPDICPMTLAHLVEARRKAGRNGVPILFITVDPARDDASTLRQYADAFGENIIALRGSPAATQAALAAFDAKAYAGEDGLFVHGSSIYLIGSGARVRTTLRGARNLENTARAIRELS